MMTTRPNQEQFYAISAAAKLLKIDTHNLVAALMLEVPLNDVTDEQHNQAKALCFGLAYGSSLSQPVTVEDFLNCSIIAQPEEDIPGNGNFIAIRVPGVTPGRVITMNEFLTNTLLSAPCRIFILPSAQRTKRYESG
jgi:hypothetical protein